MTHLKENAKVKKEAERIKVYKQPNAHIVFCGLKKNLNKKFAFVKDNKSVCFQAPILISSAGH